jgi:hypothetical protein
MFAGDAASPLVNAPLGIEETPSATVERSTEPTRSLRAVDESSII